MAVDELDVCCVARQPAPGCACREHGPALGQFKGLQSLAFKDLRPCVLEAGCLDLPSLHNCIFEEDAQVLPGVTALQCLTRVEFLGFQGPCFFDPGLVKLPQLQHMVMSHDLLHEDDGNDPACLLRLPADMGLLRPSLLYVDINGLALTHFPLALTQLVAIRFLDARSNEFAELPAGLMALSRLTELRLGRVMSEKDPLQLQVKRPLDVRALGDLSGFPGLRELNLDFGEVMLSPALLGAVRHASLGNLCFCSAHPAPESALMLMQLMQELRRLGRGSVAKFVSSSVSCVQKFLIGCAGAGALPEVYGRNGGMWAKRCKRPRLAFGTAIVLFCNILCSECSLTQYYISHALACRSTGAHRARCIQVSLQAVNSPSAQAVNLNQIGTCVCDTKLRSHATCYSHDK